MILFAVRWVLTAAHCVYGTSPHQLKVAVGDHDLRSHERGEHVGHVCRVRAHPYYSHQRITHDIALLELCAPVAFSAHVQPVALEAPGARLLPGQAVSVAGWGTQREGGATSNTLRYVTVRTVPAQQCRKAYSWLRRGQLCAGADRAEEDKDSCQGDSGGPLWREDPVQQV